MDSDIKIDLKAYGIKSLELKIEKINDKIYALTKTKEIHTNRLNKMKFGD